MLELLAPGVSSHSSGFTVQSDQPEVVRNAALYRLSGSGWKNFEVMTPDIFAVCLRPEDVISVKVGTYAVDLDIPALREQLTQALYHQFSDEYDREKHGQYVLTIRVQGSGMEAYMGRETAEDADRLTLSAGSEKDVVCLSHRNFAATPEPTRLFVRSPELYAYIVGLAQQTSRYRVDITEYPEALEELIQLFVNDEDFLSQNAQAKDTTPEDIAAWLKGEGSEPIPPEMLIIHRGTWTLSAFGDGSLLFIDLTIPSHLITQIQNICQSFGVEISW